MEKVQVHHLKSYASHPELELSQENLYSLCAGEVCNCHFVFGHLFDWKKTNPDCKADVENFRRKRND